MTLPVIWAGGTGRGVSRATLPARRPLVHTSEGAKNGDSPSSSHSSTPAPDRPAWRRPIIQPSSQHTQTEVPRRRG